MMDTYTNDLINRSLAALEDGDTATAQVLAQLATAAAIAEAG